MLLRDRMLILCDINLQVWTTRIKRDIQKDFRITTSTKICSAHFMEADFVNPNTQSRRLKTGACPSVFQWKEATQPRESSVISKRAKLEEDLKLQEEELTATASEGEGIYEETLDSKVNRGIPVNVEVMCQHKFFMKVLMSKCTTPAKEKKYMKHYTCFKSYEQFRNVLHFVLPNQDRTRVVYWNTAAAKANLVDTNLLFGCNIAAEPERGSDSEDEDPQYVDRIKEHKLELEDKFLLFMTRLKLGLSCLDLSLSVLHF